MSNRGVHSRRRLMKIVLAMAAVGPLLIACASQGGGIGFVATGPPAPLPDGGSLVPATGRLFQSAVVGQRGRPVVVNIWASWCGPCRVEAPLLERAAHHYGSKVTFLGVNAQDAPDSAARFLTRFHITYPNLVDVNGDITQALGLRGFPSTYIVDVHGRVRFSVVGGISEQTLAARLAQVLP